MGCCPSKHKAANRADLSSYNVYASTEKIGVEAGERPVSATLPVYDDVAAAVTTAHEAPSTMLMDRGDGYAIERSDHGSENKDCVAITVEVEDNNQIDHETVRPAEETAGAVMKTTEAASLLPPIEIVHEPRDAASVSAHDQVPARSPVPTSPPKTPVNFEDMPINSMYHRIHLVEVEEMEAKRRQELREEAERREREIQEFKAAMLASTEK